MRQGRQGLLRVLALVFACATMLAAATFGSAAFGQEHEGGEPPQDEAGDDPIANRGDRYVPEPPGTVKKMRFWYGPYVMPAGWDANRVDVDIPVHNGMILQVEPELRVNPDWQEPSHQVSHIHHAHWFALDPGNQEDNYTAGNTEWIFGNGDEETRADFMQRSNADPKGPFYGEYIGLAGPQAMIYMLHNKTAETKVGYVVLNVTFKYGTLEQLNATGREHRDLSGVLFGRTFDVPRERKGDGSWNTTEDMRTKEDKPRPIEWTATVDGTMIGTGSHLHPGGFRVLTENFGSEENPCRDDGRGTGGTLLLKSDILNRKAPLSEDYQTEVTRPSWRAPVYKGDRIRITGYYANKKHAWYTAMTHNGIYIDEAQPPKGRCKPYLVGKDRKKRVRKKVKSRAGVTRTVKVPLDPTEGVPNRKWGHAHDTFCGVKIGFDPCEPPFEALEPGPAASRVLIANFQYLPGGRTAPGDQARPPTVKQGDSIQFINVDQQANIRHSVTTCKYPCNGRYVSNYPWADGRWDSGTLGYDAIDGGTPDPLASTPPDLPVGKYSYFCRIHPFMRGEFQVVP
ncbi:MAG: cupredoxin domain-containing protein [Thermoleophilaceae bacterium]